MFRWFNYIFNRVPNIHGNNTYGYTAKYKNGYTVWSNSKDALELSEAQRAEEINNGTGEWINGNYYRK